MDKPVEIPSPPAAEQRPYSYERHGVTIEDPWHWLRDPNYPEVNDPDVLAYLHAENDYFEIWAKQHRELVDGLFEEMKGLEVDGTQFLREPKLDGRNKNSNPTEQMVSFCVNAGFWFPC